MGERYLKKQRIRVRHANRVGQNRETLAMLGSHADLDPALLLTVYDELANDWTLGGGATTEATADRGNDEMAQYVVVLDAQNETASRSFTCAAGALPQATYLGRVRVKASSTVADDLGIKVRNTTDSTDVLAEVLRTITSGGFTFAEFLFTLKSADAADTIQVTLTKKTATANTMKVDFLSIHPADALLESFGRVPRGGRVDDYDYTSGNLDSYKIYDAQTGGNVIETGTLTYNGGGELTSKVQVRAGRTLTTTYTWTSGNLSKKTLVVT